MPKQFKNGAQLGAWLGLTPRQNSSGGKSSLGSITKRGSNYLRNLLIQGAKAAVLTGKHNDDPTYRSGHSNCENAAAGRKLWWHSPTKTLGFFGPS